MTSSLPDIVVGTLGKVIDRVWPDPAEAAKAKLALLELNQRGDLTEFTERAGIVKAEASSESFLTSGWRPLVMLTFTGLIVARWFGWAAPNITEAEMLQLWRIVEFGLGGYVVGRSVEKTVPMVADAIKGLKK